MTFKTSCLNRLILLHRQSFINLNDSYNQEIAVQADFQTPIGSNQILELGGKDIMRRAFSDYARFEQDDDGQYYPVTTAQTMTTILTTTRMCLRDIWPIPCRLTRDTP